MGFAMRFTVLAGLAAFGLLSGERVLHKFGDDLVRIRSAMQQLAKSYKPQELTDNAFRLYERFRPEIPEGVKGWGANGVLDLGVIERLAQTER